MLLMGIRLVLETPRMALPQSHQMHGILCCVAIAAVALIPSVMLLALIQCGATVRPLYAGAVAVIGATAMGGLTMRLAEATDALDHVLIWHYLPTLLFATTGALCGKIFLKW